MSVWSTQTRGSSRHVAGAATKVWSTNARRFGPARPQRSVAVVVARAEGQDAEGAGKDPGIRSSVASLTLEEAYGVLGLSPGAPYDDVLARKSKLLEESKSNPEKALLVECANDTILSSNLQARLSGQLKVSSSVKYADVKKPSSGSRKAMENVAAKIQAVPRMTNNLLTVRPLQGQEAAKVSAVFASLLLWDVAQGIASGGSPAPSVPGLQLALGVAAVVYFQREKRVGLGKSFAIAVAGLVVGSLVGSALESYLRVDIVPFLGIDSPAVVISGGSLVALFACALLLA